MRNLGAASQGKAFHDLLGEPLGRGGHGHVGEDQASAFQAQDDEDVEDLEPDMSTATISRAWFLRKVDSVNGPLGDDVAELQEFPVNPWSAPGWVLLSHQPDETPDLGTCRRAAG
jgi:hypothetical protein